MIVVFEVEYGVTGKRDGSGGVIDGQVEVRMRGRNRGGMFYLGDLLRMSNTLKDRSLMSMLPDEFRSKNASKMLDPQLIALKQNMRPRTEVAAMEFRVSTGVCTLTVHASIVLNNLLHAVQQNEV